MSKCFVCDVQKFAKKWKGLIRNVNYGIPKDSQLCDEHLKEMVDRINSKMEKNNGKKNP